MADSETRSFAEKSLDQEFLRVPYIVRLLSLTEPSGSAVRLILLDTWEIEIGRGNAGIERQATPGGVAVQWGLPDEWASTKHARLRRVNKGFELEDLGSKNGTFVGGRKITKKLLENGDMFEVGNSMFLYRDDQELDPRSVPVREVMSSQLFDGETLAPRLEKTLAKVALAAKSSEPVLLYGKTGTGKEVCARWVHKLSQRKGEFVAVNCGALPDNLVESELFGVKKGAFSGADQDRAGLMGLADGGTLFLDEIGELTLAIQVKLLRALQERAVRPVGGEKTVKTSFRLICATNRNLEELVRTGDFRQDLLARIKGVQVTMPVLDERREDFGALLWAGIDGKASDVKITREAFRKLFSQKWPSNIRELTQVVRAAIATAEDGKTVEVENIAADPPEQRPTLEQVKDLLAKHNGNVSAVSREVGKARSQIWRWCQRYGLDPETFR